MSTLAPAENNRTKQISVDIAIPPQPRLLYEIEQVYPDIDKVAALIAEDPLISSGVLKVINSPYIGLSRNVTRLDQAVILLGLDAVMNIVNSVLLQSTFSQHLDGGLLNAYWKNTKATAVAAGLLATKIPSVRPDDAYVLGLFHNCAMPLLLQSFPNYMEVVALSYRDKSARNLVIEDQHFQANHAIIGHFIARAWNLPKSVVYAVRDHHDHTRLMGNNEEEFENYVDKLCAILKISEHIMRTPQALGQERHNYEWEIYKKYVLKKLSVPAKDLLDIVNEVLVGVRESEY